MSAAIEQLSKLPAADLAYGFVFFVSAFEALGEGRAADEVRNTLLGNVLINGVGAPLATPKTEYDLIQSMVSIARVNVHPSVVLNVVPKTEEIQFEDDAAPNFVDHHFVELMLPTFWH